MAAQTGKLVRKQGRPSDGIIDLYLVRQLPELHCLSLCLIFIVSLPAISPWSLAGAVHLFSNICEIEACHTFRAQARISAGVTVRTFTKLLTSPHFLLHHTSYFTTHRTLKDSIKPSHQSSLSFSFVCSRNQNQFTSLISSPLQLALILPLFFFSSKW